MKVQVYGIKSCDTVRKACKWLEANGAVVERIDFRASPPTKEQVKGLGGGLWIQGDEEHQRWCLPCAARREKRLERIGMG